MPSEYNIDLEKLTARGITIKNPGAAHTDFALAEAHYREAGEAQGCRSIYVDVRAADGERMVGAEVEMFWADGSNRMPIESKPGEAFGQSFPMFASGNAYGIRYAGWEIWGMGLGTIEDRHVGHEACFEFVFRQRTTATGSGSAVGVL